MMEWLMTDDGRMVLLVLAGIGFLLQVDNLVDAIRAARKGGDSDSEEKPSPPSEPDGGSSETSG